MKKHDRSRKLSRENAFGRRNGVQLIKKWIKYLAVNPFRIRNTLRWRRYRHAAPTESALPWMCFEAIDGLDRCLRPADRLFEWGSGGSTLFFADRVAEVHSVENSRDWYKRLSAIIKENNIQNINYRCIEGVPLSPDKRVDEAYLDNKPPFDQFDWTAYVSALERYADHFFDVIVIDGRARPGCIRRAIPRLRPAGLLVVDNSERKAYMEALRLLIRWETKHVYGPVCFENNFSRTSFFRKPA